MDVGERPLKVVCEIKHGKEQFALAAFRCILTLTLYSSSIVFEIGQGAQVEVMLPVDLILESLYLGALSTCRFLCIVFGFRHRITSG